jgi:uncharacterized protein
VTAFAKAAGSLEGHWPLAQLDRLSESAVADASVPIASTEVSWSARGESRSPRAGESQVWLHVTASTQLALECQRCLKPLHAKLRIARSFLFVHGEDAAAQLDADGEDDVLALTRSLDLRELLEDELLLALPLVPRHEACPQPLLAPPDAQPLEEKPHPFAALASLKRSTPPN